MAEQTLQTRLARGGTVIQITPRMRIPAALEAVDDRQTNTTL